MNALFIEELLAAQVADTVVGPEKDRGRVQTSCFLKICQDSSDLFVGLDPGIQILRPVLAKIRVIRVVWRQNYLFGISMAVGFAVLAAFQLELGEYGLVAWRFFPVAAVIDLARRDEVVVRLALVCDVVAGITEELGDQFDRLGHLVAVVIGHIASAFSGRGLAAVIVGAEGGLVHATDHGRATG